VFPFDRTVRPPLGCGARATATAAKSHFRVRARRPSSRRFADDRSTRQESRFRGERSGTLAANTRLSNFSLRLLRAIILRALEYCFIPGHPPCYGPSGTITARLSPSPPSRAAPIPLGSSSVVRGLPRRPCGSDDLPSGPTSAAPPARPADLHDVDRVLLAGARCATLTGSPSRVLAVGDDHDVPHVLPSIWNRCSRRTRGAALEGARVAGAADGGMSSARVWRITGRSRACCGCVVTGAQRLFRSKRYLSPLFPTAPSGLLSQVRMRAVRATRLRALMLSTARSSRGVQMVSSCEVIEHDDALEVGRG